MDNTPAPSSSQPIVEPADVEANAGGRSGQRPVADDFQDVDPFPIPLTSIERFHWFDDQAGYPNFVMARLEFDSELDPEIAKRAWQLALQPHPLANVYPESYRSGWAAKRWRWRSKISKDMPIDQWRHSRFDAAQVERCPVDWDAVANRCESPTGCYFGMRTWPGRDEANAGTVIWFRIHHATADGLACLQVINDWLVIYNNIKLGEPPDRKTRKIDPHLIHRRAHLGLLKWRYLSKLPMQVIALFGASKFLFRKTAHLLPNYSGDRHEESEQETYPAYVSRWLGEGATEHLYQSAIDQQVTANSILLAFWFQCLGQWRVDTAGPEVRTQDLESEWLRMILPMSIRSHTERRMPAANRTAIVQIDRKTPNADNVLALIQNLHREVRIIQGWQLEKMFLIFLRLFSLSDGLLKKAANNPSSRGISVFTDLGRPFLFATKRMKRLKKQRADVGKVGSEIVLPIDFDLMGPVRHGTPLNLSVARYDGRLKLTLHFAPATVRRDQAEELLRRLVQSLDPKSAEVS